ncbi:SRPBCC family protein [Staphylococcus edaphicus]|uniref:SRPBCC domain-containing protein n=1 Tax=Staphylococcus edaphicus TaxID=1955013 RepID=A0A2C6WPM0_9STAP|nr:SRPBCC family protein [Staphylococcus edaphicus]PHK49407.1 hypothetical protein BTJ66_08095 [Staphylococcus edaphicus]UQW81230.1 SRPBCC domain-containing protein [Staphylococcus edaphicus]
MEWEIVNLDMEFKVDASVETVFNAWTEPSLFKQWFMTSETTNEVAKNQLEVNGDWEIIDVREGTAYRAIGTYIDIVAPYKLMFSFKMPQFSDLEDIITVEFIDLQGEAQVKFNQGIKVPIDDSLDDDAVEKEKAVTKSTTEEGYVSMFRRLKQICEQ